MTCGSFNKHYCEKKNETRSNGLLSLNIPVVHLPWPPNAGEKLIWQVKIKSYPPEWQVTKSASFESLKTVPL